MMGSSLDLRLDISACSGPAVFLVFPGEEKLMNK